ncbi:hypothetical protein DEU56DRAFT_365214 [Suillus clintonianus]|uniref:uncharacterized protein n=1 Tax=Suillus clintonianus TaxID=1904413 RepID=UPI001B879A48|nr:uncharacterized protein DEU56DRAFT_365214 [Suillus clintonianus]KAG2136030.1 hypothetical protein DEU56DRAFT_365214 [Suillus clintonianus]
MSDCCDIFLSLITCCCICSSVCTNDPRACSCCCRKQDEDLEMVYPEVMQDQPQRKDPMIANNASREVAADHVQEQRRGQDTMS